MEQIPAYGAGGLLFVAVAGLLIRLFKINDTQYKTQNDRLTKTEKQIEDLKVENLACAWRVQIMVAAMNQAGLPVPAVIFTRREAEDVE